MKMDTRVLTLAVLLACFNLALCQSAGRPKKVVSVLTPPFLMRNSEGNYEGYIVDLAKELGTLTGENFTIVLAPDGQYGALKPGGFWSGMIGQLRSGDADVAMGPLTITADREKVVDFTKPFMRSGVTMVALKQPRIPLGEVTGSGICFFLHPFSVAVWVIICVAYLVISLLSGVLERVARENSSSLMVTVCSGLWWTIQALTLQGLVKGPKSVAVRVLLAFWCAGSVITICMYVGGLVNFMETEPSLLRGRNVIRPKYISKENPIQTMQELAEQSEVKYGCIEGGNTQTFFRNSSISVYHHMWDTMSRSHRNMFVNDMEEGIRRVRGGEGKYIFLGESKLSSYHVGRKPCDIELIGEEINVANYGVATPMNSQLKNPIGNAILKILEDGILNMLEKKWFEGECENESETLKVSIDVQVISGKVLQITEYAGVVILLLIGAVLAIVVCGVEYFRKGKNKKSEDL